MQGASQEGCEYGCNSFTTVPHGSKPVSSGKGNSHYYASSYSMQLLCGKLIPSFRRLLLMVSCFTLPLGSKSLQAARIVLCIAELRVSEL